ncbi:hypothetical protein, partial [Escherichia coli]|uniref:hypothetical protein n=1 Tax=Escherichia coli TaxID=562 RepID=UPI001BAA78E7
MTHLTGICRSFFIPEFPEGEQSTVHPSPYIHRYHTEIKREKRKVNSVNNQIKKNFFSPCVISV